MSINQIVGTVIGILSDLGVLPYIQGLIVLMVAVAVVQKIYDMRG